MATAFFMPILLKSEVRGLFDKNGNGFAIFKYCDYSVNIFYNFNVKFLKLGLNFEKNLNM